MVLLLPALILATSIAFFVSPASVKQKRSTVDTIQSDLTALENDGTDLLTALNNLPTTSAPLSAVIGAGIIGLSGIEAATTLALDVQGLGQIVTDPTDAAAITNQLTSLEKLFIEGITAFMARKDVAENAFKGSSSVILTTFQTLGNNLFTAFQQILPPSSQVTLDALQQGLDQAFATAFNAVPSCNPLISVSL